MAFDSYRAASLERAAMQVAVLNGLNFRGIHIETMILNFDMVETIVGRAEELAPTWEECAEKLLFAPNGLFYLGKRGSTCSDASAKLRKSWLNYRIMRTLYKILFVRQSGLSSIMKHVSNTLDRVKPLGTFFHMVELFKKRMFFDCRDCGDCALPELQFLCPHPNVPNSNATAPVAVRDSMRAKHIPTGPVFGTVFIHGPRQPVNWIRSGIPLSALVTGSSKIHPGE